MVRHVIFISSLFVLAACAGSSEESDTAAESEKSLRGRRICGGFAGLQCPSGQECVDDPSDTCDPQAGGADCSGICKDAASPPPPPPPPPARMCGGFAGIQCPSGQECVDDPSDTCDPQAGGADCSGICKTR